MDEVSSHDKNLEKRIEYPSSSSVANFYTFEPEWEFDSEEIRVEYIAYDLEYSKDGIHGSLMVQISRWDEKDEEYKPLFSHTLDRILLVDFPNYRTTGDRKFIRETSDIFSLAYQQEDYHNKEGVLLEPSAFIDPLESLIVNLKGYYQRYTDSSRIN